MKTAIVTGASGFVGGALVRELVSNGVNVYAIVRNKEKSAGLKKLDNVVIIECNMSEYKNLNQFISDKEIDVFYHFAWDGTVGEKRSDYTLQLRNAEFTCDAVKVAKTMNAKKFVFAGSIIEYEYEKCIKEKHFNIGTNYIYGIGKITARKMGQVLANSIEIDFIPTIISNIYGVGEISDRLFKSTIKKILNGEKTSFTTCEQLYDFIYIEDAARAFYLIGEKGRGFRNYYIGNRNPKKLKEFILEMRDLVNKDVKLGFGKVPNAGISLTYNEFDTNMLFNDFQYKTIVTFKEGIYRTLEWLREKGEV